MLLFNFSQYALAVDNLNKTTKLYNEETDPDKVLELRQETINYYNAHKSYNDTMVSTGYMIGTVWAINAMHAFLAGPRPQKYIHGPEPYSQ